MSTRQTIESAGKDIAKRVQQRWGQGWEYIGADAQRNAVAMECLAVVMNCGSPRVDVGTIRDIFRAATKAAGIREETT